MNASSRSIQKTYLLLLLLHTLAASFIWGINTLFLLDAGLSNTEAFAANAFFTAGMMLFEVPTGVIADTRGRRTSYLLGTVVLAISTLLYLLMWHTSAPLWAWALASAFLGLGFTFFSGAVEAWLVDALTFSGYLREGGKLESVLAKGEIVEGIAMLSGSVAGGVIAQATNLGVPYILRAVVLALAFVCAFILMRDLGFTPSHSKHPIREVKNVLRGSIEHGLANVATGFRRVPALLGNVNQNTSWEVVLPGPGTYYWSVQAVDGSAAGSVFAVEEVPVDVLESSLPVGYALSSGGPNPFSGVTTIQFSQPVSGLVSVVIYDLAGRRVRTLVNESLLAGHSTRAWDCNDDAGRTVPSGVYFVRMKTAAVVKTHKIALVR